MTKQELIKILDEKIENTINALTREQSKLIKGKPVETEYLSALRGKIDAYTDIKNLLENEVLEDGK